MKKSKLTSPKGFKAAGINCGIKKNKKDLAIIFSESPCVSAGVFTNNRVKAAPVTYTQKILLNNKIQAVIINSGNANACTGKRGEKDVLTMAKNTANSFKINKSKIAVSSTGTIGKHLPINNIKKGIEVLSSKLSSDGFINAAQAIMTTDTIAKYISRKFKINNKTFTITAIAKGAGMICPNMATMLCFICTDLAISKPLLQKVLSTSVENSFNSITVDGCQSTNDMVLALANGKANNRLINSHNNIIQKEFDCITSFLSKMIVKDGEGVNKVVEIIVKGANTVKSAKTIAFSIANSNLLKSSFYGETLNWGRIMSAIGSTDINVKSDKIDLYLNNIQIVKNGSSCKFSLHKIQNILKKKEYKILINLKQGKNSKTVWTTDLSPEYVKINAS